MFRFTRLRATLAVVLLGVLVGLAACSDNPVGDTTPADDTGLASGGIDVATGDFELTVATAGDPSRPFPGPFAILGRNIHYDDALGALVADLSVVNHSRTSFPEPVGLTFVRLLPEGVEVLNPDNDQHGDGAYIVFQFANDDAMWTPGEQSLPREVQFKVERGRAVAFVARIMVGTLPTGGSIGGIVWNDLNKDGVMDSVETGLGGVPVGLAHDDTPVTSNVRSVIRTTRTDRTGHYRFDHLIAGHYIVFKMDGGCQPTTPTQIQVLLVEDNGEVSSFLDADFGCYAELPPPPPPDTSLVEVGDWVKATGEYIAPDPTTIPIGLIARILEVKDCEPRPGPVSITDGNDCAWLPMELRGPVTAIARERHALRVMDTWLVVPPDSLLDPATNIRLWIPLDKIEVGDRVRAVVHQPGGPLPLMAIELAWWYEDEDMILGFVDRVDRDANGVPFRLLVLGTQIGLNQLTDNAP